MGGGSICIADEAISGAGLKVEKSGNITNLKLAGPQMKDGQDALWVITDWDEGKTEPTCQVSPPASKTVQAEKNLQRLLFAAHLSSNLGLR